MSDFTNKLLTGCIVLNMFFFYVSEDTFLILPRPTGKVLTFGGGVSVDTVRFWGL